jgi:single-strand DNA-binding protein
MSDFNQVTLLGNAGQDPEGRTTGDGTRVVSCSLATSEKWTDSKGQQREKTEWHRLTFWNTGRRALADLAERAIKSGDRLVDQCINAANRAPDAVARSGRGAAALATIAR